MRNQAVERRDPARRQAILRRICREYEELPGLSLTEAQAKRLFALAPDVCARVMDELVRRHVLARSADGQFVRSPTA